MEVLYSKIAAECNVCRWYLVKKDRSKGGKRKQQMELNKHLYTLEVLIYLTEDLNLIESYVLERELFILTYQTI